MNIQKKVYLVTAITAGGQQSGGESPQQPAGMAAEKAVGALCFLPKSIHRLASRYADDHDTTAKRFFMETMLIGLEQQGIITHEQRMEALKLPCEYGWKGRKTQGDSYK